MYKVKSLVGRYAHKVGLQRMKTSKGDRGEGVDRRDDDRGMGRHM